MLHKKGIFLILVIFGILFVSQCQRPPSPDKILNKIFEKISDEIEATDSQKVDLEKIKSEIKAKKRELKVGIFEFPGDAMAEQIRSPKMDEAKLIKLIQEKTQKEEQLKIFTLKKFTEFHQTLTPEQRVKLANQVLKWQDKFKEREPKD
jgi:Spy/CpxP family protein refolding chaperone